jgi:osmotically-inducible protein OsmY
MKQSRYIATSLALACAFASGGAWAAGGGSDQDISTQLVNDIFRQVAVGPYGLRVQTQNGVVRLSGSVGTVRDWKKAEAEARGAQGVTEVQNNLSVLTR